ncbi:MAG: hypothetical protein ABIK37_04555 [candidate division WOR-3 bacterium]
MSSNGQILVGLALAGLVVGVLIHNSGPDDTEPALVTQARLRQARRRSAGSNPVVKQALKLGRALTHDEQYGRSFEDDTLDEPAEDGLAELPLMTVLSLLSGGEVRVHTGGRRPGSEYEDWKFLERADSTLSSPQFQQLLKSALGADLSGRP